MEAYALLIYLNLLTGEKKPIDYTPPIFDDVNICLEWKHDLSTDMRDFEVLRSDDGRIGTITYECVKVSIEQIISPDTEISEE